MNILRATILRIYRWIFPPKITLIISVDRRYNVNIPGKIHYKGRKDDSYTCSMTHNDAIKLINSIPWPICTGFRIIKDNNE